MIGRTSPSASEPIGLRGTIPNKRSPILWEDCTALYGSTPVMSMPAPGENNVPSIKPIVIAKRVVNRYKAMVLMPMDPSLFGSPMETTPATNEVNISGTTNIFINLTKRSPIHFDEAATSPNIKPKIAPITSAATTLTHNFKLVLRPK